MNALERLPQAAAEIFGPEATAQEAYGLLTVDVPADAWITALRTARDELGCTYFDWLSAVDEPGTGLRVCAHLVALPNSAPATGGQVTASAIGEPPVRRLLLRTTVPHEAAALPTATGVYAGASWHERETCEMFGIEFTGHPNLVPLLLPDGFEGHPLRKEFVLAARVAKPWPGAKEPGESASAAHGGPKRRQMLPPGVPDPNEWGPLKGQLPPAPARPARPARAAAGERPPRRARSAGEGSASQRATGAGTQPGVRPPAPRGRTADAPWNQPGHQSTASAPDAAPGRRPADRPAGHPGGQSAGETGPGETGPGETQGGEDQ